MKITTWNVNGYRAAYSKGFRSWVDSSDADVICLQEIKVKVDQLTEEQLSYPAYPCNLLESG